MRRASSHLAEKLPSRPKPEATPPARPKHLLTMPTWAPEPGSNRGLGF